MSAQQLDAFAAPREAPRPPAPPLHRRRDPETSKAAAKVARDHADACLELVRTAFAAHGTLTQKEAERLPCFARWATNTVRRRVTQLAQPPLCEIVATSEVRDRCQVYRRATPDETARLRAEAGCP